jgi:polysaccharide biosynthesis transport protein
MRTQQPASPDDIDLGSIAGVLKKRLPKLLLCSALVGAATAGVLSQMLPKYVAQAQLEIMSTGINNPLDPKRDGSSSDVASRMDKEAVGTHVGALKSTDLALKLATDTNLASRPEFNSALPPQDNYSRVLRMIGLGAPRPNETDEDRILNAYYKALKVYQVKETRQITVEFSSSDPKFSADLANRLSDLYRSSLAGRTIVETEDASLKLKPQVERLLRETAAAEAEVTRVRGETNIFRGGQQNTGLNEQQLADLAAEQTRVQTTRSEAEARAQAAREMMARGAAEALPDVQRSTLVPRLVEQRVRLERQISELSASLLPAHPRMRQLTADLSGLQRQIKAEVQKVVDSIEKDVKIAADREVSIKRRLDETKSKVVNSGSNEAKLRSLEDNAKSKRGELERIQKQYEAAASTVGTKAVPVEAKVLSKAFPSNEKAWPKMALAPLASLATFIFGLAWVFTREAFGGARQNNVASSGGSSRINLSPAPAARTEPELTAPMALAPPMAAPAPVADVPVHVPMQSGGATQRTARSPKDVADALLSRYATQTGCRSLITGESADVDAVQDAVALAKALVEAGRQVVLVDWDQDGHRLANAIAGKVSPGMNELLSGEASFEDVIQRIPDSEAHVITAGTFDASAPGEIDPDRANLLLDALDEAYDHIIVTGSHARARDLFAATQGRFDTGILIADGRRRSVLDSAAQGNFLGFDVADLDVIRLERDVRTAPPVSGSAVRRMVGKSATSTYPARA